MRVTPVGIAATQIGVREHGRNRGPEIDEYLRRVKLDPTKGEYAWCAAFVCWCVSEAYQRDFAERGQCGPATLPIAMSAWVWDLLKHKDRICPPKAGAIFVMSHTDNPKLMPFKAHTGFVESVAGDIVHTIEGNTDGSGSREGDGVYRRTRKIADLHRFIDVEAAA